MTSEGIDSPAITLPADAWDGPAAAATEDAALYLELDGWEGPLDLLLDLARRQKVDLRRISILALVDQYLAYIERAEALRLELAAEALGQAHATLGEIGGKLDADSLLGHIFGTFCIGK